MGYSFHSGDSGESKANMVEYLTKSHSFKKENGNEVKVEHIRKTVHGNRLWSVVERTESNQCFEISKIRYIMLHLLAKDRGNWGYKSFDEHSHPYYYDCPVNFLKLAPYDKTEDSSGNSGKWREAVINLVSKEKKNKIELKVGMKIVIPTATFKNYQIVNMDDKKKIHVKCLDNGIGYNLRPKHLKVLEIVG